MVLFALGQITKFQIHIVFYFTLLNKNIYNRNSFSRPDKLQFDFQSPTGEISKRFLAFIYIFCTLLMSKRVRMNYIEHQVLNILNVLYM